MPAISDDWPAEPLEITRVYWVTSVVICICSLLAFAVLVYKTYRESTYRTVAIRSFWIKLSGDLLHVLIFFWHHITNLSNEVVVRREASCEVMISIVWVGSTLQLIGLCFLAWVPYYLVLRSSQMMKDVSVQLRHYLVFCGVGMVLLAVLLITTHAFKGSEIVRGLYCLKTNWVIPVVIGACVIAAIPSAYYSYGAYKIVRDSSHASQHGNTRRTFNVSKKLRKRGYMVMGAFFLTVGPTILVLAHDVSQTDTSNLSNIWLFMFTNAISKSTLLIDCLIVMTFASQSKLASSIARRSPTNPQQRSFTGKHTLISTTRSFGAASSQNLDSSVVTSEPTASQDLVSTSSPTHQEATATALRSSAYVLPGSLPPIRPSSLPPERL